MATSSSEQPCNRWLQLRATASEEALIQVAAERQDKHIADFIIPSACENAEQSPSDQTRFVLDEKQWKAFTTVLERPSKDKPRLHRLFTERHVAERRA
jgi:uncharacterized protein (DUF1778 family)